MNKRLLAELRAIDTQIARLRRRQDEIREALHCELIGQIGQRPSHASKPGHKFSARSVKGQVYRCLADHGPRTAAELALDLPHLAAHSIAVEVSRLRRMGRVTKDFDGRYSRVDDLHLPEVSPSATTSSASKPAIGPLENEKQVETHDSGDPTMRNNSGATFQGRTGDLRFTKPSENSAESSDSAECGPLEGLQAAPLEVVVKGSEKCIGYACPECHMFCSPLIYACKWDLAMEAALDMAKRCCNRRCEDCGAKLEKAWAYTVCPSCRTKLEATKEAERFAKATKIPEAEYGENWVYDESREKYFPSVDEWRDRYDEDQDPPTYLWATTTIDGFRLDAEALVQSELENGDHHEDAIESVEDLAGLQTTLDAWCAKQTVRSYMVDYSRAVVLAPESQP